MRCPICGNNVRDEEYLPGLNKCFDCVELIKRLHGEGKIVLCLKLVYGGWLNEETTA